MRTKRQSDSLPTRVAILWAFPFQSVSWLWDHPTHRAFPFLLTEQWPMSGFRPPSQLRGSGGLSPRFPLLKGFHSLWKERVVNIKAWRYYCKILNDRLTNNSDNNHIFKYGNACPSLKYLSRTGQGKVNFVKFAFSNVLSGLALERVGHQSAPMNWWVIIVWSLRDRKNGFKSHKSS